MVPLYLVNVYFAIFRTDKELSEKDIFKFILSPYFLKMCKNAYLQWIGLDTVTRTDLFQYPCNK
jgi:hypothetical protein